jgi:predicted outer membrane repeat protein
LSGAANTTIVIENTLFRENHSSAGGGAITIVPGSSSSFTIDASTFDGNAAQNGAGGAILLINVAGGAGTGTIANALFSNNSASQQGGAIALSLPIALTVGQSLFTGNTAQTNGGAIATASNAGPLAISQSSFIGNTAPAGAGGAIDHNGTGAATISNATFSGNGSSAAGASAIHIATGTADMDSLTIVGNGTGASALQIDAGASASLVNSIVSLNAAANVAGSIAPSRNNLIDAPAATLNLGALSYNGGGYPGSNDGASYDTRQPLPTYMPLANSSAIGAGDTALNEDECGVARMAPHTVGAVHYSIAAAAAVPVGPQWLLALLAGLLAALAATAMRAKTKGKHIR